MEKDLKLLSQYKFLFNGEPVSNLTGNEFAPIVGITLKEQINQFFNSIGNKSNSVFGEVLLDNKTFKSEKAHGFGRNKIATFKALPKILENGIEILPMDYHKADDTKIKSGMIAAPIIIANKEYIAVAVIRQNKDGDNRLYVHEVTLKEKILEDNRDFNQSVLYSSHLDPLYNQGEIMSVLRNIANAKFS
jgi:hypothetical protein